jgi:hypothetical protein
MIEAGKTTNRPTRDERLESLRHLTAIMSRSNNEIRDRTRPGMISNTDPYERRVKAASKRNNALRKLGMPATVVGDKAGVFFNKETSRSFFPGLRDAFSRRERVIWERRDDQGRFHNADGPAAVTNRGTMLFLQQGQMQAGPDGFVAITPDGRGYRGEAQAQSQFGALVGLHVKKAAREGAQKAVVGRRHKGAEAEL